MIIKKHKTPDGRLVLAICDKDLIGKKFEEGDLQLDLCSDFYNGDEKKPDCLLELTHDSCCLNVVGEHVVKLCIKHGFIDEKSVKRIGGVPYAQAIIIKD